MTNNIQLDIYHGHEASVNAYIFSDNQSIILVDCLRNSIEAKFLADIIKKQNKPLTHILITHGHPDHYLGLNIMRQDFPNAKIVVTTQEIKNEYYRIFEMDGKCWLVRKRTSNETKIAGK